MEQVSSTQALFHLRTSTRNKILLWALALVLASAGIYLWTESRYFAAVVLAPLAVLNMLDIAQRQVWVFEDRVEIQHLFTRMVARDRDRLYLEPIHKGKWALRMTGRWRALALFHSENFSNPVEESRFTQHFQIGDPTSRPDSGGNYESET